MQYLNRSFSVSSGGSPGYRDNWERIFGGRLVFKLVKNEDRKFGSADEYYHARLKVSGEDVDMLFTAGELKGAINRAARNPEDFMQYDHAEDRLLLALLDLVSM
jgi:hypothetical protein